MKTCGDLKKVFRDRISKLGAATNASEFARECGLKQQDISRYLNGASLPVSDKLVQIATRFNVTTDWLLGLSEERLNHQSVQRPQDRNPTASHMATEALVDAKIAEAASGPCRSCAAKDAIIADLSATLRDLAKSASGVGFPTPTSPSAKTLAPY